MHGLYRFGDQKQNATSKVVGDDEWDESDEDGAGDHACKFLSRRASVESNILELPRIGSWLES